MSFCIHKKSKNNEDRRKKDMTSTNELSGLAFYIMRKNNCLMLQQKICDADKGWYPKWEKSMWDKIEPLERLVSSVSLDWSLLHWLKSQIKCYMSVQAEVVL